MLGVLPAMTLAGGDHAGGHDMHSGHDMQQMEHDSHGMHGMSDDAHEAARRTAG